MASPAALFGTLAAGLLQGVAVGLNPGPLLALVVLEAVRGGARRATLIAAVPLLTDGPIVLTALLLTRGMPPPVLGALSVAGGLYLAWLGARVAQRALRGELKPPVARDPAGDLQALYNGIAANLLNPKPWLFWTLVGVPGIAAANQVAGRVGAVLLLAGFAAGMVGSKALVGIAVAHGARFVDSAVYRRILAGCGAAVCAIAVVLFVRGALIWTK